MKRIIIMINNWPFCTRDKAISQRKGKQIHIESVRIRTWNLLVASQTPYSLGVTESSSCACSHLTFYILPVSPGVTYGPQCISPAAYLGRTSRSQQGSRWQPATLVSVLSQFSSVFILVGLSSLHSLCSHLKTWFTILWLFLLNTWPVYVHSLPFIGRNCWLHEHFSYFSISF